LIVPVNSNVIGIGSVMDTFPPEYPRWMVDEQNSARVPQPFAKAR
jgi:hypothetical protein